jgi:TonB family protein
VTRLLLCVVGSVLAHLAFFALGLASPAPLEHAEPLMLIPVSLGPESPLSIPSPQEAPRAESVAERQDRVVVPAKARQQRRPGREYDPAPSASASASAAGAPPPSIPPAAPEASESSLAVTSGTSPSTGAITGTGTGTVMGTGTIAGTAVGPSGGTGTGTRAGRGSRAPPRDVCPVVAAALSRRLGAAAYPEWAGDLGLDGQLRLSLRVGQDGRPRGVRVERSSGDAGLDRYAATAARQIAGLPPGCSQAIVVPVRFQRRR